MLFIIRNPEIRNIIFIFIISLIILSFVIKKLSDGFLYLYLDDTKSKSVQYLLLVLHWGLSVFLALALPEVLLVKYVFFRELFLESQFWNLTANVLILLVSVVIISFVLRLLFISGKNS